MNGSRDADQPLVSLVVAMRNEAKSIERCMASIASQHYPTDRLEVLFYDGGSVDGTSAIVARWISGRAGWSLRVNPRAIQSAAWNLGIEAAHGDVVGIVSGHAELGPEYVAAAVETLARTGAAMVGGPVRAVGEGVVGGAIALASSARFGAGGATFRLLDHEAEVDTVFMGVCRRQTFREFPFDEEMVRDQDDELSYRILDAGGRIICNPAIESRYRSRTTLAGLWRQYFSYGYWKVRVIRKHPAQLRLRQVVPAAFVGALGATAVIGFIWRPAIALTAAICVAYVVANLLASIAVGRRGSLRSAAVLPIVFATMHLGYGLGMIGGLARATPTVIRGAGRLP